MERKYSNEEEAIKVAKEALWLAWNAARGPSGMGVFRDNPGADKEAVWKNAANMEDYPGSRAQAGRINADYVFGRMLKLYFEIKGNTLDIPDHEPRWDYQGWCGTFKTYRALFEAAELALLKEAA
jgi:hypothetical protein